MATVVCNKLDCKYRNGGACKNEFVILDMGMCNVWFNQHGQYRGKPLYTDNDQTPEDASEQPSPHQKGEE